jgi:hypothetical protein
MMVQSGAVRALLRLCNDISDPAIQGHAAAALRNLARHEPSRPVLVQVPLLLLEYPFTYLPLTGGLSCPVLVQEGCVAPLVRLCGLSADNTVLGNSLLTLATLALHQPSIPQLVAEGAARPMVQLCRTVKERQLSEAAQAGQGGAEAASSAAMLRWVPLSTAL